MLKNINCRISRSIHLWRSLKIKFILIFLVVLPLLCGGGEKVVEAPPEVPEVQIVAEESIAIPADLKPSQYKVVDVGELAIADLKGDQVYSETAEFFIDNGEQKQIVNLKPGVNSLYIKSSLNRQPIIKRWEVLLLPSFRDVKDTYPFLKEIQYISLLKIMGPYQGEGGVFLPENAVPRKEFSKILQQAAKTDPENVGFTRIGEKDYIDIDAALQAIEANLGRPVRPWRDIFGGVLDNPEHKMTRAQLARALLNMQIINKRLDKIVKDFNLKPI